MTIRVATFNASLNRSSAGDLISDLTNSDNSQAQSVAEIIQRTDADVILINEFDYDATGEAASLFQKNYLGVGQNGQAAIAYPYAYAAPSNTGVVSGFDLDNSGAAGDFAPNDAQGFGFFEGQYSFVIYSKHPIDTDNIRTFQEFLWKDMPGALLPADPEDADGNGDTSSWYTAEELDVLRLSSKNHVDVPVLIDGETVHVLAAHPTPPVFDGAEDRNGTRNHDEIRFWADYAEGADYIYDDNGTYGGLESGARFVIVGDYNADPFDGDSIPGAAQLLLDNPLINGSATNASITPTSDGGSDATDRQAGANDGHLGNPAFDTADFGFAGFTDGVANPDNAPGNLRVDYALPSEAGFEYVDGGVFWKTSTDPDFALAEFPTSDHRLVYVDLDMTKPITSAEFLGMTEIASGTEVDGTIFGGLSGIVNDSYRSDNFIAVSDDFGTDVTNRMYHIKIELGEDGYLNDGDVKIRKVVELDTSKFVSESADMEGIAQDDAGRLYISTERNTDGRYPQILVARRDGFVNDELKIDDKYVGDADDKGVQNNLGFESITISADGSMLWAATEGALTQDGDRASLDAGSPARVVKYDLKTGEPVAEYIYEVDQIAVAPNPADAFADSGLVELLAMEDGTLLALERSFSIGAEDRGYTGKLYQVEPAGATNVLAFDDLDDAGAVTTLKKTLLADLGDFGIVVDNIEGMTFGPMLDDGRQSLIIVSDDNFAAFGPQANQFIALALDTTDVAETLPAMIDPVSGWSVEVALTIGETIEETSGLFNASTAGGYTPAGVIDGIGAIRVDLDGDGHDDAVRVFANHELLQFRGSEYTMYDENGDEYGLTGARVSFFDFDIESREILDAGIAHNTIVDSNGNVAADNSVFISSGGNQWNGFSRLCSSVMVEGGEFDGRGTVDDIYFTGEEDGGFFNPVGGAEWALDIETGTMYQVAAMGRGAWENVTQIDTGDDAHVAFILADDSSPFDHDGDGMVEEAPLYLYVGEKDAKSDDFLARNGLEDGKLYVWAADAKTVSAFDALIAHIDEKLASGTLSDADTATYEFYSKLANHWNNKGDIKNLENFANKLDVDREMLIDSPAEFNGTGNVAGGTWIEVDNTPQPDLASDDGSTGYDEFGYPTQGNLWLQARDLGAFGLSRPEDVATNPDNGAEFVLASTGVDTFDVDPETGNGVDTFGTTYTMEVAFKDGVPMASDLKIIYDGDDDAARALRSPDNLDWADDGLIYVQEDKAETDTLSGDEFLFGDDAANTNEAGIVTLDPETGEITRIANIDRSVVLDPSIEDPFAAVDVDLGVAGAWESSGILDVSELFGEEGGSLFLASVQAHGIEDQEDVNADSRINDGDLVEGGQLVFLGNDALFDFG